MKCPLCGFQFEKGEAGCPSCPLHRNCQLIRCPHCSYCIVEESRLVNMLRRALKKGEDEEEKEE